MSSLWTPSGERPIRPPADSPTAGAPSSPPGAASPRPAPGVGPAGGDEEMSEEEVRAHMAEISRQILQAPASVVVANHCIGLFQLAALHLDQERPDLGQAKLAIDALGAVVETLGNRLGEEEAPLSDALRQLRLAFVAASRRQSPSTDDAGAPQ